jgi:hypothetical protein
MKRRNFALAGTMVGVGALLFAPAAEAACSLAGKWHGASMLGYPAGDAVGTCIFNVQADGNFTGTGCQAFGTDGGSTVNVTGRFILAPNCTLTGVINGPGGAVTVRTGRIDGRIGYYIGTRGPAPNHVQVRFTILSKMP